MIKFFKKFFSQNKKSDTSFLICAVCKGNGYTRLDPSNLHGETATCQNCGGEGHLKYNRYQATDANPIEYLKLIEYLYVQKRKRH